ncbi:MAG: gliding motility lipoprotein GldH [Bacteroidaceae bacterium]|nr:gliding motility lipoprotein GldH [Bacteroidaceae bacterium]
MKDSCWDRTDTVRFVLPTFIADSNCCVLVGLRITNCYPYELLIMEVEQNYQNPIAHRIDTIFYQLTDQRGDYTEKGIYYFQYETQWVPLNARKGQMGEIKIRHLMHREVLPGIMDVGIHVVH